MVRFRYSQGNDDHTTFVRWANGKIDILVLFVDDIVMTGGDLIYIKCKLV